MGKAVKVLLVDDQPDFIEPVAFGLKAAGYAVATALNGDEALKHIKKDMPDVILLDNRMPGADGPETLKGIRKIHKTLPVIMMSAFTEDVRSDELAACRVSGIFYKGDDTSKMVDLINAALKKK